MGNEIIMSSLKYFYLILLATTGVVLGKEPSPVRVSVVKREKIVDMRVVTGSLKAALISEIASLESGRIDEFFAVEGQRVNKGDIIARLDSRRIVNEMNVIRAQLKEAESRIERFNNELTIHEEESQSLLGADQSFKGSVSQQQLRQARLQTVQTKGEISILETNLVTLKEQLGGLTTSLNDTEITAPFAGIITEKHLDKGSWISAGGSIVRLLSNKKLEAWLDIPETIHTGYLKPEHITIHTDKLQLRVSSIRIIPQVNERSRNYILIAELDEESGSAIIPGMSITATVPNGLYADHLLVPYDAIMRNGAGYFVFSARKMQEGTSAIPTSVQVLFRTGSSAAIQCPDLKAGDFVITEGNERLFPMMSVSILPGAE